MDIINNAVLAKNVEKLIKQDGRKIGNISKISGIPQMTFHNYRAGKTKSMSLDIMNRMCIYFGITPNDLYLDENSMERILNEHDKISLASEIKAIEIAKAELEAKLVALRERNAIVNFELESKILPSIAEKVVAEKAENEMAEKTENEVTEKVGASDND